MTEIFKSLFNKLGWSDGDVKAFRQDEGIENFDKLKYQNGDAVKFIGDPEAGTAYSKSELIGTVYGFELSVWHDNYSFLYKVKSQSRTYSVSEGEILCKVEIKEIN